MLLNWTESGETGSLTSGVVERGPKIVKCKYPAPSDFQAPISHKYILHKYPRKIIIIFEEIKNVN